MSKKRQNFFRRLLDLDKEVLPIKEKKRVVLTNGLALMGLFFGCLFLILDLVQQMWEPLIGIIGFLFLFGLIYILNKKKFYTVARVLIVVVSFGYYFANANFLFSGKLAEFFYLLILLVVMIYTDNLYLQLVTLVLLIIAFYVPNIILEIYPKEIFGYANMSILFIALFLTVRHFTTLNLNAEKQLNLDNEIINKQKEELEKLQVFQQNFFVNVSHEIKTPLTLINGALGRINKSEYKYTELISQQSQKINDLLVDLIDLSKIEEGKLDLQVIPINVSHLAYKSFQMFESLFGNLNIGFHLHLPEKDLWCKADEKYLDRCLSNLLVNASRYLEEGDDVELVIKEENNFVLFQVIDNGRGIKKELQNSIFERFVQGQEGSIHQGNGVGLSFVKECMKIMGGDVSLSSTYGKGSNFTLSLIPTIPQVIKKEELIISKVAFPPDVKVLLVDDNPDMIDYLSLVFSDIDTIIARNGEEALYILKSERIDCVVTDFMMPKMNGLELLTEIKNQNIDTSVIILTAKSDQESRLSALRLGVDDYVYKPFVEEELLLKVNSLIINRSARVTNAISDNTPIQKGDKRNKFLDELQHVLLEKGSPKNIKITDLADRLNISHSTLLRNVKLYTGLTAKQYLKEVLLQKARDVYESDPKVAIKFLAEVAGIKNQTYFKNEFYKRFGINLMDKD